MNLLFTALIVVWAAWLILKKYKPQTVLFVAGGLLLAGSMIMSWGTILPAGKSTGMWSFDIFELIRTLLRTDSPVSASTSWLSAALHVTWIRSARAMRWSPSPSAR